MRELVELRRPPREVLDELRPFGWDSEEYLCEVGARDVRRVLGGFLNGELASSTVEEWADAIEARDDVSFVSPAVQRAVFVLANPALEGSLDSMKAAELRAGLLSD